MTDEQINAATVTLTKLGGRGVLIPGGMILTAAHCIGWTANGRMAMGEYFVEDVVTSNGQRFRVGPIFVEPVADIAVLGRLDNQVFVDDWQAFGRFVGSTLPIPLSKFETEPYIKFPIRGRSHDGRWIAGTGEFTGPNPSTAWIETEESIYGGASGGPIVDMLGELFGIVTHVSTGDQIAVCNGVSPRPQRTLSVEIAEAIEAAQTDIN